jgi:hypothetical protein
MDGSVILKYRSTYTGLHHTQFASEFTCHLLSSELAMPLARRIGNVVKTFLDLSVFQRITENFIFFKRYLLSILFTMIGFTFCMII